MKTLSYVPDGRPWETMAVSLQEAVGRVPRVLRERADALISVAHPDFRAELRREPAAR